MVGDWSLDGKRGLVEEWWGEVGCLVDVRWLADDSW